MAKSWRMVVGHRLLTLALMIMVSGCVSTAFAADDQPVNVAIVMDSSGSMKHTDPDFLRRPAAKLFVSLLTAEDQASIISFSDQGYPVARGVRTNSDKNLDRLFAAIDRISSLGVYTNITAALDTARQILDSDSGNKRRKLVVLMSDGKMDVGNDTQSRAATKRLFDEVLPALKASHIALQTIAFTENSDQELLAKLAKETGGEFYLTKTDQDLHNTFTQIIEEQTQPSMIPMTEGRFDIDKSVTEVTIVGAKDSAEVSLSLVAPSAKRFTAADKSASIRWLQSPLFDLITIDSPEPGAWQLQASNNKNKAYVVTNLKLVASVDNTSPVTGDTVSIRAWLEKDNAILTQQEIIDSVNLNADVLLPDGNHVEFIIGRHFTENGGIEENAVFASQVIVTMPGRYEVTLQADSGTFKRNRKLIFRVSDKPVMTEPASPIHPITSVDSSPAQSAASNSDPMASSADEKTTIKSKNKKPDSASNNSSTNKASTKTAKNPDEGNSEENNSRILFIAIYIFVSINILIGMIVLAIYLWRRHTRQQ